MPAWVKVTLNGTVVFKGVIVSGATKLNGTGGQANKLPLESGTIFLQSHWGSQVEFRNPVVDETTPVTRS